MIILIVMSDKKHISYERRGTQFVIYFNREGIVEEKGRCVLSITEADARKDAIITTVGACIMMLFVTAVMGNVIKDSNDPIFSMWAKGSIFLVLVVMAIYVFWAWRSVKHRSAPIILTCNGILIPKKDEILWGDIEKIYFRRPLSQRGSTKMYIKRYEQRRIEIKEWSAYASKEQWLELLPKYAKRDIVDTDFHWF